MDKEQFKIQIYHHQYTRGVVVTICRILIWSLVYALIAAVFGSAMATSLGIDINSVNNTTYEVANVGPVAIISSLVIVVSTIVYYWAIITAIVRKIRQNKKLTELEDEYIGRRKK